MYLKPLAALAFSIALPAQAASDDAISELYDVLRLDDVIAIMRAEGIAYGTDLESEMFPDGGGVPWQRAVTAIYDADAMADRVRSGLAEKIEDPAAEALIAFFESDPGRTIVTLEVEARRAMQDTDVEEAAEDRAAQMRAAGGARIDLIDRFVSVNGLIEQNIAGALNSNYAFYSGLDEGNAFPGVMTEDQIIADVWAQEPEIRADTEQWVYGYLALAYQPLTDADLDAYIDLSESDAGQALNDALFSAFDAVYTDISHRLGLRAADFMQGQDI